VTAASAVLSIAAVCSRPPLEQSSPPVAADDAVASADDDAPVPAALALALASPAALADAEVPAPLAPALALTPVVAPAVTLVPPACTVTLLLVVLLPVADWAKAGVQKQSAASSAMADTVFMMFSEAGLPVRRINISLPAKVARDSKYSAGPVSRAVDNP